MLRGEMSPLWALLYASQDTNAQRPVPCSSTLFILQKRKSASGTRCSHLLQEKNMSEEMSCRVCVFGSGESCSGVEEQSLLAIMKAGAERPPEGQARRGKSRMDAKTWTVWTPGLLQQREKLRCFT